MGENGRVESSLHRLTSRSLCGRDVGHDTQALAASPFRFFTDDPLRSLKDVLMTLCLSLLQEFISGLPDGIDTFVGERGTQLSGGQVCGSFSGQLAS